MSGSNALKHRAVCSKRSEYTDRLFLILFDTVDGDVTKDDIIAFGKLPCANRVVLSKNRYPDIDYVITIPLNKKDKNVHYMDRNIIGRRRFDSKFDYVSWINCENQN